MIHIGITMGDPGGVGPEVILQALANQPEPDKFQGKVYGDEGLLRRLARVFGIEMNFCVSGKKPLDWSSDLAGKFSEKFARASVEYLQAAAIDLQKGEIDALVTAPIHKRALRICNQPGP